MLGEHVTLVMLGVPLLLLSPARGDWGFYGLVVLYLNKDFLNGRSPFKRLLGTQVQQAGGAAANELQCVVRNMTFPIWPLEVLVVAVTGHKRLGDYLVHTQVIDIPKTARSWRQDLTAYRINAYTLWAVLVTALYLLFLQALFRWLGF